MQCNHEKLDNLPFHTHKHCVTCGISELEIKLQAEIESLQCCGNCEHMKGKPYFSCDNMDIQSMNRFRCRKCCNWRKANYEKTDSER